MKNDCPFAEQLKRTLLKNTPPVCFHCGSSYIKDRKHSGQLYTTWMPDCMCINKTTIRIVTGGYK